MNADPRQRRTLLQRAVLIVFVVALGACTSTTGDRQDRPSDTGSPTGALQGTTPTHTYLTLDPAKPSPAPTGPPSEASITAVAAARGNLGLNDNEALCLAQRLELDPTLRDSVAAERPGDSPRWQEINDLAADCVRVTTGAAEFANGIQEQTGGTLELTTLECLRNRYAALPADDVAAFVRDALDPATADPIQQNKLLDLLRACGINPDSLPKG